MLDTLKMKERLRQGGFTDEQADALVSVIRELAGVFVTREYLDAELAKLRTELAKSERRIIAINAGVTALLLTVFGFVAGLI